MTSNNLAENTIARRFDRAAGSYDLAASVQAQIARHLVQKAIQRLLEPPNAVLDIGCGTGFVARAVADHWPRADITAIDGAPAMLEQAGGKVPKLRAITGDIAAMQFDPSFDLVLSSMALHWLPDARTELRRWRTWLKPQGRLFAALLVGGSFDEWRDLCAAEGVADGLWPLPSADFTGDAAGQIERQTMTVDYSSAQDFLHHLKATGAATPHSGHKPFGASVMRRVLARAPKPFTVSYRVLYIEDP